MSLSKQLLILISLLFFLIMTVNFITSVNNIRDYLEVESEIHAQDTATSLGLSLRPYIADTSDTMLESMVLAIYDSGYYQEINLEDMKGREIIKRHRPESFDGVPDWFVSLLPMRLAKAQTEISSGWMISGKLFVTVSPGIAYLKLWEQANATLIYSAEIFVLSVLVLLLLLRLVLKPLGRIEQLALNIADGRFETISPLPWTTEIKNVAVSMNMMSRKTEALINSLNTKLEEASKRLKVDDLTGLETQSGFDVEMKRVFIDRKESHLIVTRIEALGSFARERGHTTADKLVKDFAQTLRKSAAEFDPGSILPFRMIGAKFVVVLRGDKLFTEKYCQRVGEQLGVLCEKYELKDLAHMGIVPIDLFSTTNAAMDFANEAYEKARIIGPNSVAYEEAKEGVRNMDQWRALLTEVIDQVRFKVVLLMGARGVKKENLGEMVLEEATSQAIDNSGDPIPIGTFVSLAESFGMAMSFDKAVVNKILQVIRQEKITHDVAINLSLTSISDIGFQDWLRETIGGNDDLKGQLVFAVTAYSATKNLPTFKIFIDFVHSMGCKILLKRFEPTLLPMKDLKNYRLDYIRLARSYTQGISTDEQKRNLVQSMGELGDLIDVKVLAEGVEDEDDYEIITQSGLFAASR